MFASVGAGLDSVIDAQAAALPRLPRGRPRPIAGSTSISAAVLTPQLIGALVALGLLALVPVVVKRVLHAPRQGISSQAAAERGSRPDA